MAAQEYYFFRSFYVVVMPLPGNQERRRKYNNYRPEISRATATKRKRFFFASKRTRWYPSLMRLVTCAYFFLLLDLHHGHRSRYIDAARSVVGLLAGCCHTVGEITRKSSQKPLPYREDFEKSKFPELAWRN